MKTFIFIFIGWAIGTMLWEFFKTLPDQAERKHMYRMAEIRALTDGLGKAGNVKVKLLYYLVEKAGGRFEVTPEMLDRRDSTKELAIFRDPETNVIVLQCQEDVGTKPPKPRP